MGESIASTANLKLHERLIFDAYRNRMAKEKALTFAAGPSDEGLDELIASLQVYRELGATKQEKTTDDYLIEITEERSEERRVGKECRTGRKQKREHKREMA